MQQTTPSQSRKNVRRAVLVWGIPVLLVFLLVFANSASWWLAIIAILWLLLIWGVSSSERKKAARARAAARFTADRDVPAYRVCPNAGI